MGRHAKPVTWNGVTYDSVYDAAAAFDLSAAAVRWRLKRGIPLDAPPHFCKAAVVRGTRKSAKELARECGVSAWTIRRRVNAGKVPDLPGHYGKACEYDGKRYASVAAMARELGINWKNALVLVESEGRWL